MSKEPTATTTSYAILGLLTVKPWSTYELIQQVDRSLRRFWPRAQSKLYEEPKKLVALGWADAEHEPVGRRHRTRYTITPAGRRALAAWLRAPGAGPVLEFEQLLKVHFADSGTKQDLLATLAATGRWASEQTQDNLAIARAYLAHQGEFQHRLPVNMLVGRFMLDFYAMVANWAQWAADVVATWPDDLAAVSPDEADLAEIVRRAEAVAAVEEPRHG